MFNRKGNKFSFLTMTIIHLNDVSSLILNFLYPGVHGELKQYYFGY